MFLDNITGNKLISDKLANNEVFGIQRLGVIELNSVFSYLYTGNLPDNLKYMLKNNAGVYGDNLTDFLDEYIENIPKCGIHAILNDPNTINEQQYILHKLNTKSIKIEHRSVEPFYFSDPWSKYLADKNILVISPFVDSIKNQYQQREKLWNNKNILPKFNLITFQSIQSIGNSGPHEKWINSLNYMKNEISNINFDIALLGCGAYGTPLVSHISNNLRKTAIYIGGGLQILFGIKGKRWDSHNEISQMYNEYWTRPSASETPSSYNSVENGCYW